MAQHHEPLIWKITHSPNALSPNFNWWFYIISTSCNCLLYNYGLPTLVLKTNKPTTFIGRNHQSVWFSEHLFDSHVRISFWIFLHSFKNTDLVLNSDRSQTGKGLINPLSGFHMSTFTYSRLTISRLVIG